MSCDGVESSLAVQKEPGVNMLHFQVREETQQRDECFPSPDCPDPDSQIPAQPYLGSNACANPKPCLIESMLTLLLPAFVLALS